MATTWSDIKRLAGDLQRAQLSEGSKKLSEANCIEIVAKLIANGSIQLCISNGGREYVTKRHLLTEIRNECLGTGGRVSLADLAVRLGIDYDSIEAAVAVVVREKDPQQLASDQFYSCGAELIHRDYIDGLCEQLNERLEEEGQLSIYQLTRTWNVPTEVLSNFITPEIGVRIRAHLFDDILYTTHYIHSLKRQLVAAVMATTKVATLLAFRDFLDISMSLFASLWEELVAERQINGDLIGKANSPKTVFIPRLHETRVAKLIETRFLQNDFIDCRILKKLNVVNTQQFLQKCLSAKQLKGLTPLPNVLIGEEMWNEMEAHIKESCLSEAGKGYCLLADCIPPALASSNCMDADNSRQLVERVCKRNPTLTASSDFELVFNRGILQRLLDSIRPLVERQAEEDAPDLLKQIKQSGPHAERRQEREAKQETPSEKNNDNDDGGDNWDMGGKAGRKGGKAAKKGAQPKAGGGGKAKQAQQHTARKQSDYEESAASRVDIGSALDVDAFIQRGSQLCVGGPLPEELLGELREKLHPNILAYYHSAVEKSLQGMQSAMMREQRQEYEERSSALKQLYTSICCFEQGAEALGEDGDDSSMVNELKRHLMKTLGTEFADHFLALISNTTKHVGSAAPKLREASLAAVEDESTRSLVRSLYEATNGSADSIGKFHEHAESLLGLHCGGNLLDKPDKKAKSVFHDTYGKELERQLEDNPDSPTALLLLVLLILHTVYGLTIHASGKFVSGLLHFLQGKPDGKLPAEVLTALAEIEKLVIAAIKSKAGKKSATPLEGSRDDAIGAKVAIIKNFLASCHKA